MKLGEAKKLAVYSTGSGIILGEKIKNKIYGVFVSSHTKLQDEDFANLLKAELKDEIVTISVNKLSGVSKRNLTTKEKILHNTATIQMVSAIESKDAWLVEQVFDELRGK